MIEEAKSSKRSRDLAVTLYDRWVRERQRRRDVTYADGKDIVKEHRENVAKQLTEPRQKHLNELKEVASEVSTADKVGLMVMMELPVLEVSALLHRLSIQVAQDPKAPFFSKVNQVMVCGSDCG